MKRYRYRYELNPPVHAGWQRARTSTSTTAHAVKFWLSQWTG